MFKIKDDLVIMPQSLSLCMAANASTIFNSSRREAKKYGSLIEYTRVKLAEVGMYPQTIGTLLIYVFPDGSIMYQKRNSWGYKTKLT